MQATREDLVKIAREVVTGPNRPSYCANPAAFDPHEWVLEAMDRAYRRGLHDGMSLYPGGRLMSAFEGWAVVELLGHRVRYGRVSEVTMFGEAMLKLEIPTEPPTEEFYSGKALYGIRPATEEAVRRYHQPQRLDRPALASTSDADLVDDAPDPRSVCGGCGNRIWWGEPTEEVKDDNDDVTVWHKNCAEQVAELIDQAVPDPVDSDAPRSPL